MNAREPTPHIDMQSTKSLAPTSRMVKGYLWLPILDHFSLAQSFK